MNRLEDDNDLITRQQWLKLVRFNAYTPKDGEAYLSDGTYVDFNNSAFDGLTDDTSHVLLVLK